MSAFFRLCSVLSLLLAFSSASLADAVAIWTDPTRPFLAGTIDGKPYSLSQEWGLVFDAPSDQNVLLSVNLGFQLRDYVYAPGDASTFLQLRLFSWSRGSTSPVGVPIVTTKAAFASDLTGPTDPWGNRRYSFDLDEVITPGESYFLQFIGNGFVLFQTGPGNAELFLNQNASGWGGFSIGGSAAILSFGDSSVVSVPGTMTLVVSSMATVLALRRRKINGHRLRFSRPTATGSSLFR